MTDLLEGRTLEQKIGDHGVVKLIDCMPRLVAPGETFDDAVCQAARVSYGENEKKALPKTNRGLIRYLMRHHHGTPFEMVDIKFYMSLPIFVARQLIRHRTACLSADTKLWFDLPSGPKNGKRKSHRVSIKDIFKRWNRNDGQRSRIRNMMLRQVNEDTKEIGYTKITNVFDSGDRECFHVKFENGYEICCSADHRLFTDKGWLTLKEAADLVVGSVQIKRYSTDTAVFVNGIEAWRSKDWMTERRSEGLSVKEIAACAGCSYDNIRKWLRIYGLQFSPEEIKRPMPWNKGRNYRLSPRPGHSRLMKRIARRGKDSNFYINGNYCGEDRALPLSIRRKIFERDAWQCRLCGTRKDIAVHHVVPYVVDPSLHLVESNLATVCKKCHKVIHHTTESWRDYFHASLVQIKYQPRAKVKRIAHNKLTVAHPQKIKSIEFVGIRHCYDIEVEGQYHNFIADGIVVHNSINEYSMRYKQPKDRFFVPDLDAVTLQSTDNKQGSAGPAPKDLATQFINQTKRTIAEATAGYQMYETDGIAREINRINMPLSAFTEWYWEIDLRNLLGFLVLRLEKHAQKQIRDYADAMYSICKPLAPYTFEAFEDFMTGSITLSALEIEAILKRAPLAGRATDRERVEFEEKLKRLGLGS